MNRLAASAVVLMVFCGSAVGLDQRSTLADDVKPTPTAAKAKGEDSNVGKPSSPTSSTAVIPGMPSDAIVVDLCELEFELSTMVGTNTGAVGSLTIQNSYVQLGDKVKAGQTIGRLNDLEIVARLKLLEKLATNDIDTRVADSRLKEAKLSLERITNLRKRGANYASEEEYGQVRLEADTAQLQLEQSKQRCEVAALEYAEAQAQAKNREVIAPHDGTIVEVYKKVGETISANEPVFAIVNTDIIRVIGSLNVEDYGRVSPGQQILLYPELDELTADQKKRKPAVGKIVFVDRRFDPKTRTNKVIAHVDNSNNNGEELPSGVQARMIILPKGYQVKTDNASTSKPPLSAPISDVPAAASTAKPPLSPAGPTTTPTTVKPVSDVGTTKPANTSDRTDVAKNRTPENAPKPR